MENYLSTIYDRQLSVIDSLTYLPWVGKQYPTLQKEKKILIVLESVYNWEKNDANKIEDAELMLAQNDFVRVIVKDHGLFFTPDSGGVEDSKFARGIERSFFNKGDVTNSERESLWPFVSFHEFVQRPMKNIDEKPNKEDFRIGAKVLKDVIKIIQPRTCIFFGTSFAKIAPLQNEFGITVSYPSIEKLNGAWPSILNIISENSDSCRIICVKHPSRYFSWDLWYKFIVENLPSPFYWEENK